MIFRFFCLALGLAFLVPAFPCSAADTPQNGSIRRWEQSIVTIEVTRKQYDYFQPWSKKLKTNQKVGLVLPDNEILTTADEVYDLTLVRLQKGGRGKWWVGKVDWIDYHSNLAIIKTEEPSFWQGLAPIELAEPGLPEGDLQIVRWFTGNLETRKVEFTQFRVETGHLSYVPHVQLFVSSEVKGIGWGEPIVSGGKVVGIATEQNDGTCYVLPSGFVQPILEARKKGEYRGLGYFDFYWQPAQNPASLEYLKLNGEPRGVLVTEVPSKPGKASPLKSHDLILQVDGFDIDIEGDYQDPHYGYLSLENLSSRGKWAGDSVKLKIWRDGKPLDIDYVLPKADYNATLVPDAVYDSEPEYLIVGGLVFQPLTDAFLQGWGADWRRRSPFRLFYYNNQSPTPERPALVLLQQVLPDPYTLGYHDLRHLVVDEVNGKKISHLRDLEEALQSPINGFHQIKFMESDSLRRLVVAADTLEQATKRVLQRFGIASASHIETSSKKPAVTAKAKTGEGESAR